MKSIFPPVSVIDAMSDSPEKLTNQQRVQATDALLLVTSACPHCPAMMKQLSALLKEGVLGKLEMINIVTRPEVAAQYKVRSVPWLKLGELEFSGALTRREIEDWIKLAEGQGDNHKALADQLKAGALDDVVALARQQPRIVDDLLSILAGKDVPLTVRIGISAVIESLVDRPELLDGLVPEILKLTAHQDPATRADACHFLGMVDSEEARKGLEACLEDSEQMVREIARESLEGLQQLP